AGGFSSITGVKTASKLEINHFDRFQKQPSLGGSYASPIRNRGEGVGDLHYTYDSRALKDKMEDGMYYFSFKIRPTARSGLSIEEGDVMPWFGVNEKMVGEQIKVNIPFHNLDAHSDLQDIVAKQRVDGHWRKCVLEGKNVLTELQTKINDLLPLSWGDELVDVLNNTPDLKKLFKNSSNKDELINAWKIAFDHGDDLAKDVSFIEKLGDHLKANENLSDDLRDIDIFNAYKRVRDDIDQGYEILDDIEGNLSKIIADKLSTSNAMNFWKWILRGKKFEQDYLFPKLLDRNSSEYNLLKNKVSNEFGVNLDEYDMYSQVQLKYNDSGDYFVADQVYLKWETTPLGLNKIRDIIIVENKLKATTRLTKNQIEGKSSKSLKVRSKNVEAASAVTGNSLNKSTVIDIPAKWIKIYDSDSGDMISGIDKL
ncbi:MAG: hypothetical protein AB3N16_07540, partial [Flavobacteriaceae bacterium]